MSEIIPCACGNPVPCYLRANESQTPCPKASLAAKYTQRCIHCECLPCNCYAGSLPNAPVYGGAIRSIAELMIRCAKESGVVISANACTAQEIAEARADQRLFVDPSGAGYVLQSRAWLDKLRNCKC